MGSQVDSMKESCANSTSQDQEISEDNKNHDVEARVEAIWEQMKKGVLCKKMSQAENKHISSPTNPTRNCNNNWMGYLGLKPKKQGSLREELSAPHQSNFCTLNNLSKSHNWIGSVGFESKNSALSDGKGCQQSVSSSRENGADFAEARKLASSALAAVKDASAAAAAADGDGSHGRSKAEARDFAGEEMEVRKMRMVDAESSKEGIAATTPSAVDAVLEQIRKKPRVSVMEKTKLDWGEFKEENRAMEEELDAYKKSSGQYLEKLSFLQRADYREFERERDARLALQARRRPAP